MNTWRLFAGWVVVVTATTALTWQIVSLADNQVSARPVAVAPATSTTDHGSTTSTTAAPSSTSSTSSPTTTTPGDATTTSSASPSPSTTAPDTTSTSTETWSVRTVTSIGGTVVVRYRPNEVELQAATPLPGFDMEIEDEGPQRVRVEFENNDIDIRIEVRWEDGGLDVDVTGES